jgi:hypothetical protein
MTYTLVLLLTILVNTPTAEKDHCPEQSCRQQNADSAHMYITGFFQTYETEVCPSATVPVS